MWIASYLCDISSRLSLGQTAHGLVVFEWSSLTHSIKVLYVTLTVKQQFTNFYRDNLKLDYLISYQIFNVSIY